MAREVFEVAHGNLEGSLVDTHCSFNTRAHWSEDDILLMMVSYSFSCVGRSMEVVEPQKCIGDLSFLFQSFFSFMNSFTAIFAMTPCIAIALQWYCDALSV